jgi:outer membrane receptor for monomeric catechols
LYTRYDFSRDSFLKGLAIGGGAAKAGGKWFNMSGLTLPNGQPLPKNSSGNSLFKLEQDVMLNLFASYKLNRNWEFRLDCANVLDESFPIGAQGVGLVDAAEPRTFSFQTTFRY